MRIVLSEPIPEIHSQEILSRWYINHEESLCSLIKEHQIDETSVSNDPFSIRRKMVFASFDVRCKKLGILVSSLVEGLMHRCDDEPLHSKWIEGSNELPNLTKIKPFLEALSNSSLYDN